MLEATSENRITSYRTILEFLDRYLSLEASRPAPAAERPAGPGRG